MDISVADLIFKIEVVVEFMVAIVSLFFFEVGSQENLTSGTLPFE